MGIAAGVMALGKNFKINGRELRDILSPFKAQETDSKGTALAKKLANYGLRA